MRQKGRCKMERKVKHEVVVELLKEVLEEESQLLKKEDELIKQKEKLFIAKQSTNEIVKELKHLTAIHREQRNTIKWLKRKMVKLEEEA